MTNKEFTENRKAIDTAVQAMITDFTERKPSAYATHKADAEKAVKAIITAFSVDVACTGMIIDAVYGHSVKAVKADDKKTVTGMTSVKTPSAFLTQVIMPVFAGKDYKNALTGTVRVGKCAIGSQENNRRAEMNADIIATSLGFSKDSDQYKALLAQCKTMKWSKPETK